MKMRMSSIMIVALGIFSASSAEGQALREVFKRVNSSVVVINTIRDVIKSPQNERVRVAEVGSGVLISNDGEIRHVGSSAPGVGMLIQYIAKNSPAALMGLRGGTTTATVQGENVILGGDVVLTVQEISLSMNNYEKIQSVVSRLDPEDIVRVKILRAAEQLELSTKKHP